MRNCALHGPTALARSTVFATSLWIPDELIQRFHRLGTLNEVWKKTDTMTWLLPEKFTRFDDPRADLNLRNLSNPRMHLCETSVQGGGIWM
jgi:hypothetical protein